MQGLAMATTTNDPADGISRSSNKAKESSRCSDQACRLIPTFQLPEELLYEVFLRLPVKSLSRFGCLSKGMYRMIDCSNFISNHNIHRSVVTERDGSLPDDEDYAVLLYQRKNNNCLFSVHFDNNNLNLAKAIEINCTFAKEGMIPMGWCCNGVFCFKNHINDPTRYVFWNPSNGTFREVDCSSCLISTNVSMGYDYVNDDYKIIRVMVATNGESSLEVYSFRKDSWRKFLGDFDFPSGNNGLIEAVCVRGVMHWLWVNRTDLSMFISAFDLVTEAFTSLPLPLEARELNLEPCHVTELGGRLCVSFYPPGYGCGQTVWVMEKYGVESSWTKFYTFDSPHRVPCFYYPNNERRLLCNNIRDIRGLSWWNSEDDTFESIELTGPSYDRCIRTQAYIYVRNLVRLDQS